MLSLFLMFVVGKNVLHIVCLSLSPSPSRFVLNSDSLLAWLIRAPLFHYAGNTFAQYRVGRACPFLRQYPHLADFENAARPGGGANIMVDAAVIRLTARTVEKSIEVEERILSPTCC